MASDNKKIFEVETDGRNAKYAVLRPSPKVAERAKLVYGKAYRDATEAGLIVRDRVTEVLKSQGLWDDEKEKKYAELEGRIEEGRLKLAKGGIKKSEAFKVAVQMRIDRNEKSAMFASWGSLDDKTCESFADKTKLDFLTAECTVFNDGSQAGKRVFENVEEFLKRDRDEVAKKAAEAAAGYAFGYDEGYQAKLPENAFLLKYGMARGDDMHLTLPDGRRVNWQMKLVDERDRLIDEEGRLVDEQGRVLEEKKTEQGFVEFEDDLVGPAKAEDETEPRMAAVDVADEAGDVAKPS